MQWDTTQILAERIAQILNDERAGSDLSSLAASIEKLNERLERIEAAIKPADQVQPVKLSHPSTDRFAIAEAIADEVFGKIQQEKTCTFEPNGRPCDHCSMCSSRGF